MVHGKPDGEKKKDEDENMKVIVITEGTNNDDHDTVTTTSFVKPVTPRVMIEWSSLFDHQDQYLSSTACDIFLKELRKSSNIL